MAGWTPHDLPFLVEKAKRQYQDDAENLRIEAESSRNEHDLMIANHWNHAAIELENPDLSWLDTDVCALVEHTFSTLPEWTPSECLPSPHGVVGFEKLFATTQWNVDGETRRIPIHAVSWQVQNETVNISAWTIAPPNDIKRRVIEKSIGSTQSLYVNAKWLELIDPDGLTDGEESFRDVERILAIVGAIWLLMTQPRVMEEDSSITHAVKTRRSPGSGIFKRDIRVSVRSLSSGVSIPRRASGRKAVSRWWVRGHWRQQAWGKGRKLRKPVYIAPHLAGNEDVEVDERPGVQIWRE